MAFIIAAGFASSRTSVLSSTEAGVARAQPAPEMQQMGIRHGYDCLLSRISSGMRENATKLNHLDLERLGRRAAAACQFQEMLADLKDQIARKVAMRTESACADGIVELSYKAS
jgi:hypothetical protein